LNGGAPRLVGDLMCSSARWSPDNRRIACVRGTNIFVANSDGSAARIVGSFSSFPGNVIWSPDGTRLRFLLYDQLARTASSWEITLPQNIETSASAPARLNLGPSCCDDWSWTRNGQSFAYTRPDSNGILSLAVTSENRSLLDRFPYESKLPLKVGEIVSLAPGQTEDSLFIISKSTSRGELLKFDARHKTLQLIFNGLSVDYLFFSRDGQWMTYVDRLGHPTAIKLLSWGNCLTGPGESFSSAGMAEVRKRPHRVTTIKEPRPGLQTANLLSTPTSCVRTRSPVGCGAWICQRGGWRFCPIVRDSAQQDGLRTENI
jgi:hypothetical protein